MSCPLEFRGREGRLSKIDCHKVEGLVWVLTEMLTSVILFTDIPAKPEPSPPWR